MSHFLSSKSNQDFEDLNQQLLRRQPVEDDVAEEDEGQENEPSDRVDHDSEGLNQQQSQTSASQPPPSGLTARRKPDLSAPSSSTSTPRRAATPSQVATLRATSGLHATRSPSYSRTNSPERIERTRSPVSRPQSHARNSTYDSLSRPISTYGENSSSSQSSGLLDTGLIHRRLHEADHPHSAPHSHESGHHHASPRHVAFSDSGSGNGDPHSLASSYHESDLERHGANEPLLGPRTFIARRGTGMLNQAETRKKLGTWDGVWVPQTLNVLGVILFLRFGFILGQVGLIGSLGLLVVSYAIDTLTALSISALATNGVVRAGGIFYLASRSLGPEFGGATGLLFWLGQSLNASLNALGFVETLTDAFGVSREESSDVFGLPEGPWWSFAYGSFVLLLSTVICLVGSRLFMKATMIVGVIFAVSLVSIPLSSVLLGPFADEDRNIFYTGWSLDTLRSNLFPHFTSGAAGSASGSEKENWSSVFGVLFPAVTGILAGASMSGDLRKPSKSIPKGTNWSLVCTFIVYAVVLFIMAATTARTSFYLDIGVMGDISVLPIIITLGALSSTAFSALMGIQACGKVLQAIARDHLLPALDVFAQGTDESDTPTYGIVATYIFCQSVLLVDSVNLIAQLVTMTSLLCFAVLSFACLALKAGGAPSFRPSFPYFSIYTAAGGTLASLVAMFFTDSTAASGCILLAVILFGAIHIFSPPKPWGDVTRNIHYWLTRKYLLRLDERKTNLKHWRPQVLLLANDPRREWNLIIFCNSLKKGGLYVLGHCIKGNFTECLPELKKQQVAWLKLVDFSRIKSFVDIIIASSEREGARSLIMSAGLGGMRPNIVVLGFPRDLQPEVNVKGPPTGQTASEITVRGPQASESTQTARLPTDAARKESPITAASWVGIIEDALALNKAVAVAYGFDIMQLPGPSSSTQYEKLDNNQYIDLWPIQIASPDSDPEHAWDTYTMVLQLGTILSMTGTWKSHTLRVSVFVEDTAEVEEERTRVRALLDNLRIPATLRVFCLSDGSVSSYEAIVVGKKAKIGPRIEETLQGDPWWSALKDLRRDEEQRAKAAAAKRKSSMPPGTSAIPTPPTPGLPVADSSARRSKREQKIFGYTLPDEHKEYFQRNIRIGLAHPRAKPKREDSDDEDSDSSSGSDRSNLSDELLRLGDDEFFGARGGLPRSRTTPVLSGHRRSFSGSSGKKGTMSQRRASQAALPDEPMRRPIPTSSAAAASSPSSYGSMAATPVVRPDGTVIDADALLRSRKGSQDGDGTLKASDRARFVRSDSSDESNTPTPMLGRSLDSRYFHGGGQQQQQRDRVPSTSARRSTAAAAASQSRRGSTRQNDSRPMTRSGLSSTVNSRPPSSTDSVGSQSSRQGAEGAAGKDANEDDGTPKYLPDSPLHHLTFNTTPTRAQLLILNDLFRTHSSSSETSVILTSLPAPESGCASESAEGGGKGAPARYLAQLETLFGGATPVLGIHARELTLSMSL